MLTLRMIPMRNVLPCCALLMSAAMMGCSDRSAPINQPVGYKSHSELKARLLEVSQYGDGGSSLGGISESIEQLMEGEPEKGKKLLADFQRLNTSNSKEERKKIAKAMADQLN